MDDGGAVLDIAIQANYRGLAVANRRPWQGSHRFFGKLLTELFSKRHEIGEIVLRPSSQRVANDRAGGNPRYRNQCQQRSFAVDRLADQQLPSDIHCQPPNMRA
jgi:hypothetical protein